MMMMMMMRTERVNRSTTKVILKRETREFPEEEKDLRASVRRALGSMIPYLCSCMYICTTTKLTASVCGVGGSFIN